MATNGTDFAEVAPSPEEIALKAEIETVVRQAISTLRETDRRLMEARYIEGVRLRSAAGRVRFIVCGDCQPPQACKAGDSLPNRKTVGLCGGVAGSNIYFRRYRSREIISESETRNGRGCRSYRYRWGRCVVSSGI